MQKQPGGSVLLLLNSVGVWGLAGVGGGPRSLAMYWTIHVSSGLYIPSASSQMQSLSYKGHCVFFAGWKENNLNLSGLTWDEGGKAEIVVPGPERGLGYRGTAAHAALRCRDCLIEGSSRWLSLPPLFPSAFQYLNNRSYLKTTTITITNPPTHTYRGLFPLRTER